MSNIEITKADLIKDLGDIEAKDLVESISRVIQYQIDVEVIEKLGIELIRVEIRDRAVAKEAINWLKETFEHSPLTDGREFAFSNPIEAEMFILKWL